MQLLPLLAIFLAGVILRRVGLVSERHSSLLLSAVFYVGLPIVIFLAIVKVNLNGLVYLALLPPVIVTVTTLVALLLRKTALRRVKAKTFGSLLAGSAILNIGFLYPFVTTSYGADGLARLAVIDCFNAIMIFSVLYIVIAGLAQHRPKVSAIVSRVLIAPTLWALVIGITFKFSGASVPMPVMNIFEPMALIVSWTLLFALGIKFKWQLKHPGLFTIELVLRLGLGALVGICFIKLFGLHGIDAQIILVASMAPIGLNSITLAEIEKLDVDFAVSAVSLGLLIGMVVVPITIHIANSISW
ncbi:MAG: Auxin Efflux Carrier [Candidatus Saccharibacteria bacterium]|nr:Auxin Efflux Carrier [Candidatus Saccharibacteria bacterium]